LGDNLTEAIKIALVAGDDRFPDLVEDMDVLKRPIHRDACPVIHGIERYRAVIFWATQMVNHKQMRSLDFLEDQVILICGAIRPRKNKPPVATLVKIERLGGQHKAVRPPPADKFFRIGICVEYIIDRGVDNTATDDGSALFLRGKIHGMRSLCLCRTDVRPHYITVSWLVKWQFDADALGRLKQQPGKNIGTAGSPNLARRLMEANLLDEPTLMIHPVVVGKGKRLFEGEGALKRMKLGGLHR
jgi:hypothetical protein